LGFKRLRRCNQPDLIKPINDPLVEQTSVTNHISGCDDAFSKPDKSQ